MSGKCNSEDKLVLSNLDINSLTDAETGLLEPVPAEEYERYDRISGIGFGLASFDYLVVI